MQVIVEDEDCIGGERKVDLEHALSYGFHAGGISAGERFAQLVVMLQEKGILSIEDCGQLCGQYYMRKAGDHE